MIPITVPFRHFAFVATANWHPYSMLVVGFITTNIKFGHVTCHVNTVGRETRLTRLTSETCLVSGRVRPRHTL